MAVQPLAFHLHFIPHLAPIAHGDAKGGLCADHFEFSLHFWISSTCLECWVLTASPSLAEDAHLSHTHLALALLPAAIVPHSNIIKGTAHKRKVGRCFWGANWLRMTERRAGREADTPGRANLDRGRGQNWQPCPNFTLSLGGCDRASQGRNNSAREIKRLWLDVRDRAKDWSRQEIS